MSASSCLLTDRYELTMVEAARRSGAADRECVFEIYTRSLPTYRSYGVLAGVGRLIDQIKNFRFDGESLAWLDQEKVVSKPTLNWLADYRFRGDIDGFLEGEIFFPNEPVLSIRSSFAEAVVLETLSLSCLNFDSAVAGAAARMVQAASGRPLVDMGSRRTHEQAAVSAARAAYIAGFAATSNLEAGRRWSLPTIGTAAHAFSLLHNSEAEAFRAQIESLGVETTLLVDTFDVVAGTVLAVNIAGPRLGGVRIDSGDLPAQVSLIRDLLDQMGAPDTRIVVTSNLDEFAIAGLRASPVDVFGVGTSLVTGSGSCTAGFVYKPVAKKIRDVWKPVAKTSPAKAGLGGVKRVWRNLDSQGRARQDLVVVHDPGKEPKAPAGFGELVQLMQPLVREGKSLIPSGYEGVNLARKHHKDSIQALKPQALRLKSFETAVTVKHLKKED